MATYNGERFVRDQLETILSQLPPDAEVIVADDGSTDRSLKIIEAVGDSRVRILPEGPHLGPIYNFERALKEAKGDVIFLSDQDDAWIPGKVQLMLDALGFDGATFETNAPWLAVHDAIFMDSAGDPLTSINRFSQYMTMWSRRPYKRGVFRNWMKNSYTGCCMAFRKELLKFALPFPKNLPMHDQWLGLVAERKNRVVAIPQSLILYRIHENNATHLVGGKPCGFVQRLKWRWNLLRSLLSRT